MGTQTSVEPRTRPRAPGAVLIRYMQVALMVRLASEGARVALVVLAVDRTGSAAFGGALVAALLVPGLVAAPPAGALADRVRRRRLFHAGALVGHGLGLAAVAGLTGRAPAPVALAAAGAAGCCTPLVTGGLTSLLGDLLPPAALGRAFSLDAVTYNLAGIAGPALVSVLAAAVGPAPALLALGAVAVAGGLLVLSLPLRPRPAPDGPALRPGDVKAAAVLLVRDPPLRSLTWASGLGQFGIGALPVVCVLLATRYQAPWAAGGLMTVMAVGSLAGSLAYAWRPWGDRRPERTVLAMLCATGVPLAAVSWTGGPLAAAVGFALAGCCTGPLFAALLAGRDRYAPPAARTQVFTLGASVKSAFSAAGAALAGACQAAGPARLVLAVACCQVAAAALGALLLRRRRAAGDTST
ncbi:MFS transporter [Streptomyces longispororuber]|uniref:MFS transporter n=1 Tax=Streptomyces longispororuber TaxID=68230 RepID=A0A919DI83_9ACTN|nr:MFS transporter [Streptomyces longispororuber]GHE49924.1 MFS transporter [Streptomyces longispororuber]